ncbi:MAG: nickel pincer cofactor biosynthesis protein LarB [Chloroflexota bacterium]|nr:nickel pincer cofactor biosynthesis protein LarB [Chloroflexota bacterium]
MRDILKQLAQGQITVDEAEKSIRILELMEVENLAQLDIGREFRKGIPEIILAEGKPPEQTGQIALAMVQKQGHVVVSRADDAHFRSIRKIMPSTIHIMESAHARIVVLRKAGFAPYDFGGRVGILAAGTSDMPIAEEAKILSIEMGCHVLEEYDVGVAGVHRLFPPLKQMLEEQVDVLVVVAGREGALPSLVAGLVDIPIIAVPTSIGYGFGEKGTAALAAMLQACPLGLAVVNIDAGIAAGAIAALIANRAAKARASKE